MFTLGAFSAAAQDGLAAILRDLPALSGVSVETIDIPGVDGALFANAALGQAVWEFDLRASSPTPAGTIAIADAVTAACSPHRGLQALTIDVLPGWLWYAICDTELRWTRDVWVPNAECAFKTVLKLRCPDPVGHATPDETANGATSATINRLKGNVPSRPRIEITGTFTGVTVTIGGLPLTITGINVSSGRKLVLDYDDMDFAVWNTAGTVKLAHATPGMSTYAPFTLPLGPTLISAAPIGGGSVTGVTVHANSRRV